MAGGKITRVALGKSTTEVEGNFEGFYQKLSMSAGDNNAFKAKVTDHKNPAKEPKAGKYFVKGWWTNHKDEPIKRAIYGQLLRFHIEMDKSYAKPGDIVYFAMYDSDMRSFGNDIIKADDPILLIHSTTKKPYTWEKVNNENKVIIHFSTDETLEKWTALDQDKIFELYFRCSYVNNNNTEHVDLPYNFHDYLQLGSIVIDRYKMPGLKPDGSDIADDMTYGTGLPHRNPIYLENRLSKYKEEYTTFGFDFSKHALFADAEDGLLMEEYEIEEEVMPNKKQEEFKIPIDNTMVYKPQFPTFTEQRNALIKVRNKNVKAIYSKEKINELFIMRGAISVDDEGLLWNKFKDMVQDIFSSGKLEANILMMVDKMKQNKGGIYENSDLTNAILANPATSSYCQNVEDYIAEQLKINFSKLEKAEDKEPYFKVGKDVYSNTKGKNRTDAEKNFRSPAYTWKKNWNIFRGETIALNDIWATEVILKEVKFNGDDYTAKYEVTLWDHFGLDIPDVDVVLSQGKVYAFLAGFRAWFVLQHLWGYKPLLTKMNFTKEFAGNLNRGAAEINAERAAEEQRRKEELIEKTQQEIWNSPKL